MLPPKKMEDGMSEDRENRTDRKNGELSGFKNYLLVIFFTLSLVIVGFICYKIGARVYKGSTPDIDSQYISSKLEEASDLTTAVLTYNGLVKYSDGDIPFITQKSFSMIYSAEVRAGIDMSKIKVEVTDDKVIVTLPEVEIQGINVDSDSLEFFDEKAAIFNWTDKDDVVEAVAAAENDVSENADINGLKERSRTQAEEIIKGLLKDSIGERTLEIK
jgi:hypothetical protein